MHVINLRRQRNRRIFTAVAATMAIAVLLVPTLVLAKPPADEGPKKVWVCHFDGHDADQAWPVGDISLDGDYVVAWRQGMPESDQVEYCEEDHGGHLILISVNALDGHGAQLQDRLGDYPPGFKG